MSETRSPQRKHFHLRKDTNYTDAAFSDPGRRVLLRRVHWFVRHNRCDRHVISRHADDSTRPMEREVPPRDAFDFTALVTKPRNKAMIDSHGEAHNYAERVHAR